MNIKFNVMGDCMLGIDAHPFIIRFTEVGPYHFSGGSSRRNIIVKESAFGDYVKIHSEYQCVSQQDVSTSEYLLRHCHIITVSPASLPTVQYIYWSEEFYASCYHLVYHTNNQCCHLAHTGYSSRTETDNIANKPRLSARQINKTTQKAQGCN